MEAFSIERPSGFACLEVVSGPAAGQRLPLSEIRFGCGETGAGALCGDRWLSRAHAAVRRGASGQFEVEDLGAVEGTAVNGSSLRGPQPLHIGDVIELGASRMVVRELAEAEQASAGTTTYTPPRDSRRVLAAIADAIIEVGISYAAIRVFSSLVLERGTNVLYAAIGFVVAAQLTYRFLAESLAGQTLGKHLFGIRVVRVDGKPLDPNAVLIRTVMLLVDGWLLIGLLALVITGRRRRQRLGDLAAGTIVVPASATHAGFARRDRDRLMLASPLLWLVTIAIGLHLLGPGLQACQSAELAPPIAKEGSCIALFEGVPVGLTVVNAGHKLSLPTYDVTLEQAAVRRESAFSSVVSFKVRVENKSATPFALGANREAVQLMLSHDDGTTVPVPADAPARTAGGQIASAGTTQTVIVSFTVPSEDAAAVTDPPTDLTFLAGDQSHPSLGQIRLWRASGSAGQAAIAGLTR